jgi:hypothetical protein
MEFLNLVDCLHETLFSQEEDQHIWRLNASGQYSAKSSYRAYFNGDVTFEPCVGYGSVGPPENVNSSYVLPFKTGVGQPIALHIEEWIILRSAPCVIKKKRPFSTFLLNVFSQDRFGLPSCRHWRLEEQHRTTTDTHLPIGWPKLFVTLRRRAEKE